MLEDLSSERYQELLVTLDSGLRALPVLSVEVDTGEPIRSFRFPGEQQGIFASALLSNGEKLLVGTRMVANSRQSLPTDARIMLTDVRTGEIEGEIALGYLKRGFNSVGSKVEATLNGTGFVPVEIVDLPFIPRRSI